MRLSTTALISLWMAAHSCACAAPETRDTALPSKEPVDEVIATPEGEEPSIETPATPATAEPSLPKPTSTCETARDVGGIAGDVDGPPLTVRGTCSEWLRMRVTEDDNDDLSVWANDMKLRLKLTSQDADFDLHVYLDTKKAAPDAIECSKEAGKSELPVGQSDVVSLHWGESLTANGVDDSRTVSIEVRAKDPASCEHGTWELVLESHR